MKQNINFFKCCNRRSYIISTISRYSQFCNSGLHNWLQCTLGIDPNTLYRLHREYLLLSICDRSVKADVPIALAIDNYTGVTAFLLTDGECVVRGVDALKCSDTDGYAEYPAYDIADAIREDISDDLNDTGMFGGHLPQMYPEKTVCVVQNAQTALLGSIAFPEYTWTAVGYGRNISAPALQSMQAREITLCPNEMEIEWWIAVAKELPNVRINDVFARVGDENEYLINILKERKLYEIK